MLQVTRITSADELLPLAGDWNRLASDVPFRQFAWHHAWWRHYGVAGRELFVLVVRDAENPNHVRGIAPWFIEGTPSRGRVIAPLGSGEVCSDYQSLLTQPGDAQAVSEAIADWLTAAASDLNSNNAWDLLHLDSIPTSDEAMSRLV